MLGSRKIRKEIVTAKDDYVAPSPLPTSRKAGFISDLFARSLRTKVRFFSGIFQTGRDPPAPAQYTDQSYVAPQTDYGTSQQTGYEPLKPSYGLSDGSNKPSSSSHRYPTFSYGPPGSASTPSTGSSAVPKPRCADFN